MEYFDETFASDDSRIHQYPDPAYAAHVTKYPWVVEEDDCVISGLHSNSLAQLDHDLWPNDGSSVAATNDEQSSDSASSPASCHKRMKIDSDYQANEICSTYVRFNA